MAAPRRVGGQALVELAVFGSLLLLVLGYLVNTLLGADYHQQVKAEAFRRGLASSTSAPVNGVPVSQSHLLIQDRHLPDPSNPFGLGSVTSVSSQASVTRNYQMQLVPENDSELPQLSIQIANAAGCPAGRASMQGGQLTCGYTLAAFRTEVAQQTSLGRYKFIYGDSNVCNTSDCGGGNTVCIEWGPPEINPETGLEEIPCINYGQTLVITDSCAGQIISYEDCTRRARQITDSAACEAACVKASLGDCNVTCSQPMGGPQPWYVAGGALDAVFTGAGIAAMGVQPGATQTLADTSQITTTQNAGGTTSTTDVNRVETTTRSIVRVGGTDAIDAQKTRQSTTNWSTTWP